ncbi:hypothetical protein IFM89_020925 [Coptis chinensis]|uniref:Golgi apparatus membrane protein TVP23 n=1 Tax=Coptis chinensis TaxID=261450 RepID=A0A835ITN4_9MAGN|nr:hypothetical protein IFM89_020925 [Coptis chinensis]
MNKKDSWLFWWTLYITAVAWIFLGIFSLIRFQPDYLLVVGVCLTLSIANIVGFTKCRKGYAYIRVSYFSEPSTEARSSNSPVSHGLAQKSDCRDMTLALVISYQNGVSHFSPDREVNNREIDPNNLINLDIQGGDIIEME